jgi:hypothetical protein
LEGFPRTKVEAEVLIKHNLHVDAFVVLRVESDLAARRVIAERRSELREAQMELVEMQAKHGETSQKAINASKAVDAALAKLSKPSDELIDELIDRFEVKVYQIAINDTNSKC